MPQDQRRALGLDPVPKPWRITRAWVLQLVLAVAMVVSASVWTVPRWVVILCAANMLWTDLIELYAQRLRHDTSEIEKETNALRCANAFAAGVQVARQAVHGQRAEKQPQKPN